MSLNALLISDTILKERSLVHGNTDPKLIYPDIKAAQDMYILPVIGTALYAKLQAAVTAGDWTNLVDYKLLMDDYIVDALINFTLAEMPLSSFQFWNKGLLRKGGQDTETPSMSELLDISNRFRTRAEFYAKRLRDFLIQNGNTKYKEYFAPGNGVDTVVPAQNTFTLPISLDDDCGCEDLRYKTFNKPYSE